jgi:hypothetical protein
MLEYYDAVNQDADIVDLTNGTPLGSAATLFGLDDRN